MRYDGGPPRRVLGSDCMAGVCPVPGADVAWRSWKGPPSAVSSLPHFVGISPSRSASSTAPDPARPCAPMMATCAWAAMHAVGYRMRADNCRSGAAARRRAADLRALQKVRRHFEKTFEERNELETLELSVGIRRNLHERKRQAALCQGRRGWPVARPFITCSPALSERTWCSHARRPAARPMNPALRPYDATRCPLPSVRYLCCPQCLDYAISGSSLTSQRAYSRSSRTPPPRRKRVHTRSHPGCCL